MRSIALLSPLLLVAPSVACNTGDPVIDDSASIAGVVTSTATGLGIPGVVLTTLPETARAETDADGRYAITHGTKLGATYQLSAAKEGFETTTLPITLKQGVNVANFSLKVQKICQAGAKRCAAGGAEAVEECNTAGSAWTSTPCPTDQVCDLSGEARCTSSQALTTEIVGPGSGVIISSPAGINCGASCSKRWPTGATVALTASPFVLSAFTGWSGDCAGTDPTCHVTLDRARHAAAHFSVTGHTITIRRTGNGAVTSNPSGINCPSACMAGFDTGTEVVLSAGPAAGSAFGSWSGDACVGSGNVCRVTVDRDLVIEVHFVTPHYTLTVTKEGTGAGDVASTPEGIDCGDTCAHDFDQRTEVTLSASPAPGSDFIGWGGECSGTDDCTVIMSAAKNVTARFDGITHAVTVTRQGNGSGRVTSTPSGIDCGTDCAEDFGDGELVSLAAIPDDGHAFTGWAGACTGTSTTCALEVTEPKTVSATFEVRAPYLLPLDGDPSCTSLLHFDQPGPLEQACGTGVPASLTGSYGSVPSRSGPLAEAYQANGTNEDAWIDTGSAGPVPPEATVELTLRKSGNAMQGRTRGVVFSNKDALDPSGPGFRLYVTNDGRLGAETDDGAGGTTTAETPAGAIANGRWYQVAATLSSSTGIQLFVDGRSTLSVPGPAHFAASSSTAWAGSEREGRTGARERFNGTLDELRVSNTRRY